MKKSPNGKIIYVLQAIYIIPLLFFGIIIMFLASHWFGEAMYEEISVELQNAAFSIDTMFDLAYPGDYKLVGETAFQLYKGDHDLTTDYALIDQVSDETGLSITLFYQDTRILTTIRDQEGERIVGSGAPALVVENVLGSGEARFFTTSLINNSAYFSYYMPLKNSDGSTVGMLFVGKPRQSIDEAIHQSVYPLMVMVLLTTLIMALCLTRYTNNFVSILLKIRHFLSDVTAGNLSAELDASVLRRSDELGDIGRSALTMQRSLRTMIEQDALTQLFNRRSGDRKLRQVMEKAAASGTPYCIAIGDIDFFKKVNDTYGHECGDMVLKNVAKVLHQAMLKTGFVARWGGEEFLLVYDHHTLDEAYALLSQVVDDIRSLDNEYFEHHIKVTMTFGMTAGSQLSMKEILREADERLYQGKETGRDKIVR